jgi:hypothetical protein
MNIEKPLRLFSGERLEIPERLHPIVIAAKALDSAALEMDDRIMIWKPFLLKFVPRWCVDRIVWHT